jgi:alginate O-acetyltransferase complex protein AlgI
MGRRVWYTRRHSYDISAPLCDLKEQKMLFTTPIFLFFFIPILLTLYYFTPAYGVWRNYVALCASVFFFAWGEPVFVFVLLLTTYLDYRISKIVSDNSKFSPRSRTIVLCVGIFINVGILLWSKYTNFVLESIAVPLANIFSYKFSQVEVPLILGISFITFHKISFLVDSFKGRATPPRSFADCALYIFLFPQLIAGPIIRYQEIGNQIHSRSHTASDVLIGLTRFTIGFAKKTLIADPMGGVTDKIFGYQAGTVPMLYAWIGIVAYTLQIYFDFSGYSDMAIGLARTMAFRFPENFNRPYVSKSITEFWTRWHISLSNWMRNYLYIPLGGNRVSNRRMYLNLWIVFLVSGLWHGAAWNFIAWGGYYGLFLCIEKILSGRQFFSKNRPIAARLYTLLVIMIGWVLFRSPNLRYALTYIGTLFGIVSPKLGPSLVEVAFFLDHRSIAIMVIAIVLACTPIAATGPFSVLNRPWAALNAVHTRLHVAIQLCGTMCLLAINVMSMATAAYSPFLYFRF